MSSATKGMYSLKPIIGLPQQIPLPQVMYELPKIQGSSSAQPSDSIVADIQRQIPLPEYNILETRQMKILEQLCELKEQIESLCVSIRLSDANKVSGSGTFANQESVQGELILYANPSRPPYLVLALQRIWKDITFNVQFHQHSSISNADAHAFEQKLLLTKNSNAAHSINLILIWKDVRDVQLVTKVYDYPIEGEANVLRYLLRLIKTYNYEDSKTSTESSLVDSVLDLCLRLPYEEPRNVNAITSKFTNFLGKNSWFLNSSEASAVDAIVWSIIKQVTQNRVPRELNNWYHACETLFLSA